MCVRLVTCVRLVMRVRLVMCVRLVTYVVLIGVPIEVLGSDELDGIEFLTVSLTTIPVLV